MFADAPIPGMTHSTPHSALPNDRPLILVLPFKSRAGEEWSYLAEGVSDELVLALTQLSTLRVVARGSAATFRGAPGAPEAPGAAGSYGALVGASAVIAGAVEISGDTLRVEAVLATVASPAQESALVATLQLADFSAGVAGLAEVAARYCDVATSERWRTQTARPLAADSESVDLVLRGRYHLEQRPIGVKLAMQCFDRAIRLDGSAAVAYGALGILWANFGIFLALPPGQARARAREQAQRALALDPRELNAHAALLAVATFYDWDPVRADALGAQLLRWYPSWVTPRQVLLYAHAARGDAAALRALGREVQQLDPRATDPVNDVGFALILTGAAAEATSLLSTHARLHPEASEVHRRLGLAWLEAGDPTQAVASLERSVALSRRHAWGVANLACALARAGREVDARRLLAELVERAEGELVPGVALAEVHASLGEADLVFAALEGALTARDYWLLVVDTDPLLAPIRADARFPSFRARCAPPTS